MRYLRRKNSRADRIEVKRRILSVDVRSRARQLSKADTVVECEMNEETLRCLGRIHVAIIFYARSRAL